ncbi:tail fiber protein [Yersinia enterocolitica]|nr:tail fiber protein [Yersinia enterocolitica]
MPDLPPTQSNEAKWFTEGGNSVSPSWPGSTWFNIIQAEMLNVLAAASITPDKENLSQLSEAIQHLITSGVPDLKDASLTQKGIVQLSNATNSNSEILAATPKAVSDLGALLLKITNNLSEIKDAGPAAVAQTLANLGLGEAAEIDVATAAEVITGSENKAVTAATLKNRFNTVVLYPNGTEASPPTLKANQRIVIDNPFPGRPVVAQVEILANSIWAAPYFMTAPYGNAGPAAGATPSYLYETDKIVIQTGLDGVLYKSNLSGSAHNFTAGGDVWSGTIYSSKPYRLRVRAI